MNVVPKVSFLAAGALLSIIRQKGVIFFSGLPARYSSCAASATIRKKIPDVMGQRSNVKICKCANLHQIHSFFW
jgi:hypothetical protein